MFHQEPCGLPWPRAGFGQDRNEQSKFGLVGAGGSDESANRVVVEDHVTGSGQTRQAG